MASYVCGAFNHTPKRRQDVIRFEPVLRLMGGVFIQPGDDARAELMECHRRSFYGVGGRSVVCGLVIALEGEQRPYGVRVALSPRALEQNFQTSAALG